jgi:S1-C subfamily serine protease
MDRSESLLKLLRLVIWLMASLYLLSLFLPLIEGVVHQNISGKPRLVAQDSVLNVDEKTAIDVFKNTNKSVVYISTNKIVRSFWERDVRRVPKGTGSGFMWDKFGHVVTNYHVIEGAAEAIITLSDGRHAPARLVGISPEHDLAVLKVMLQDDLPLPIPLGKSANLQVGQSVLAIGNPFGLDKTLTSGIVSALNRSLSSDSDLVINNLIQTDAAINPGNSGGPLLDSQGRLIGVNTAIYSPSGAYAGIGFAVPVDTVNRVVPQLILHGKYVRPSLGVMVDEDINSQLKSELGFSGVAVLDIPQNSHNFGKLEGAQLTYGGIVLGDVIVAIEGARIDSVASLLTLLDNYEVGDVIDVEIKRKARSVSLKLVLK